MKIAAKKKKEDKPENLWQVGNTVHFFGARLLKIDVPADAAVSAEIDGFKKKSLQRRLESFKLIFQLSESMSSLMLLHNRDNLFYR